MDACQLKLQLIESYCTATIAYSQAVGLQSDMLRVSSSRTEYEALNSERPERHSRLARTPSSNWNATSMSTAAEFDFKSGHYTV
jgi:hypothetical protein